MSVVCLMSGGLDSTVLAAEYIKAGSEVEAISFDYGQRHKRELQAAKRVCDALNIEQSVVKLDLASLAPTSSQTSEDIPVPHGHYADESMRITVVPNRNMVMISLAIARAIAIKAEAVAYAAHLGDHAIYPDCRPEFVEAMNFAAALCHYEPVELLAPYQRISKSEIVVRGVNCGAPMELTYSCYEGRKAHCGKCGTCVERREAFERAGVKDPTVYAEAASA